MTLLLKLQCQEEQVYAYAFEGVRYDAGDKLGYLKATVEFALESPELGKDFAVFLKKLMTEQMGESK